MNAATAAGLLGGDVSAKFTPSKEGDGQCAFARQSGAMLHIEVRTMESPPAQFAAFMRPCQSDITRLKGIGNTAGACGVMLNDKKVAERVAGLVREHAFSVTLIPAGTMQPNAARESAKKAAEIVAGNLF